MAAKSRVTGRRVRTEHVENGRASRGRRSWSGRGPSRVLARRDAVPAGARGHRVPESGDCADGEGSSAEFWKDDGVSKVVNSEITLLRMFRRLHREESRDRHFNLTNSIVGRCSSRDYDSEISASYVVLLSCSLDCVRIASTAGSTLTKQSVAALQALALAMNRLRLMTGFVDKLMSFIEKYSTYSIKMSLLPVIKQVYESSEECAESPGYLLSAAGDLVLRLQSILEQEQSSSVMCALVDVQLSASRLVPTALNTVFKDLVDILVGWHIEPGGRNDVRSFVADAMLRLHVHWSLEPQFGLMLTSQFVEDIAAYTQDIGDVDLQAASDDKEQIANSEEIIKKLLELIRVYSAVVKALSRAAVPVTGDSAFGPIVTALLTVVKLDFCLTVHSQEDVANAGSECLSLLLPLLSCSLSVADIESVSGFVRYTSTSLPVLSDQCLLAVCNFYCTVLKRCGSGLLESVLDCLFGSHCLLKLRKLNRQVNNAVLDVYRAGLSLKNVPLLLSMYAHVVGSLQSSVAAISTVYESTSGGDGVVESVDVSSHVDQAMFLLQTLTEFVNTNNSIIGLWALRPSLVALLCFTGDSGGSDPDALISLHSPAVLQLAPEVQTAALTVLRSHCARHRHFISTSALLITDSNQLTPTPSSGRNFVSILELLTHILAQESCPSAGFCFTWAAELFQLVAAIGQQLCDTAPLVSLFRSVVTRAIHVLASGSCEERAAKVVKTCAFIVSSLSSTQILPLYPDCIYRLCILAINNVSTRVRSAALSLAARLHPEKLVTAVCAHTVAMATASRYKSPSAAKPSPATSHRQQKIASAQPTLLITQFCHLLSDPNHWKSANRWQVYQQLLSSSASHVTGENKQRGSVTVAPSSVADLNVRWCSAAAQCLASQKLRVAPFVKADKFLTALDVQLQSSCSSLARGSCWPPVSFLLSLHRSVRVASFGSALTAADFTQAVCTFYQVNRRTCVEWLNQAERHALSALADKVFSIPPSMALALLYSLITYGKEVTCFVTLAVGVAINAGCGDTVLGLASLLPTDKYSGISLQHLALNSETANCKVMDTLTNSTLNTFSWIDASYLLANSRLSDGADVMRRFLLEHDEFVSNEKNRMLSSQLCNQVLESYMKIGRYEDAAVWENQMNSFNIDLFGGEFAIEDTVRLMYMFSDGDYAGAASVADRLVCKVDDFSLISARSYIAGCLSSLKCNNRLPYSSEVLQNIRDSLSERLYSNLGVASSECLSPLVLCLQMVQQLSEVESGRKLRVSVGMESTGGSWNDEASRLDSSSLVTLSQWQAVLSQCGPSVSAESTFNWPLRLKAVKSLRKECELMAAGRFLLSSPSLPVLSVLLASSGESVSSSVQRLSENQLVEGLAALVHSQPADEHGLEICHEAVKIIHSQGGQLLAIQSLLSSASITCPRSLMLVAKYLSLRSDHLPHELNLDMLFDPSRPSDLFDSMVENMNPADLQVGRVLQRAALLTESSVSESGSLAPAEGKCWRAWADWCFRQARGGRDGDSSRHSTSPLARAVRRLLVGTEHELVELICDVLASKENESDSDGVQEEELTEEADMSCLRGRLLELVAPSVVDALLTVRREERVRARQYHGRAATAYLHYLSHLSQLEIGQSHVTLACLRLLQLLPSCADQLKLLHLTPTAAWHTVIPQLFARLEHSKQCVRSTVSRLLAEIGSKSVQLIVFPTVVGSDTCRVKNEPANVMKEHGDSVRREAYTNLLQTLSEKDESCVHSVCTLIAELRRVTVLWHELWLSALQQCQQDLSRRLPALQLQFKQLTAREDLHETECAAIASEKYNIAVAPVLFLLNRVLEMTSVSPETPHENQFQQLYLGDLREAVSGLKTPVDVFSPRAAWEPLRRMLSRLQRHLHGRAAHCLNLRFISPVLNDMKDTRVYLPGVDGTSSDRVRLASIDSNVVVLPTKTKPKKLLFCGSDGARYPYLFKGQDDLHLDERLMQLLNATNKILSKSVKNRDLAYRCRVYAVVPLGRRCGLIQWVSESAPLFSIYKRWQQRQQTTGGGTGAVQRPSEMFSARLQAAVKAAGLSSNTPRRQIPAELLLDVFSQLVKETPRNILATELWSCSSSCSHWWSLGRQYSVSLAVMSMVGYIIGLGDRHLDNILFDVKTGEVVHIDYNVCFEKGRSLRVPECVPFRLTQNLVTALGVTGVEGVFRAGCERVLLALRRGCDTLLALLHTFVFDPLIDWAPSADLGITGAMYGGQFVLAERQMRGRVELNLTKSLICVQVAEIKSDWTKNKDRFVEVLTDLKTSLSCCRDSLLETNSLRRKCSLLELVLLDVGEARVDRQHSLWSVLSRWRAFCERKSMEQQMITHLDRTIENWSQLDRQQREAESWLFSDGVGNVSAVLSSLSLQLCLDGVVQFLNSTGQQQLANQCQDLNILIEERFASLLSALHSSVWCFVRVVALLSCMPLPQRRLQHRYRVYLDWLTSLRQHLSRDRLAEIVVLAERTMSTGSGTESTLSLVHQYRTQLRRVIKQNERRVSELKHKLLSDTVPSPAEIGTENCEDGQISRVVLLSTMYTHICQLLKLENTVLDTGDVCQELASPVDNGLFVLDELSVSVHCLCELFQHHNQPQEERQSSAIVDCSNQFERLHQLNSSLQTLLNRFSSVIVAEAVLLVQQQEPSVGLVISSLDNMIDRYLPQPASVIAGLEAHVHRLSFGLTSEHTSLVQTARDLRAEFSQHIDAASNREAGMSRGEMLLVGAHMMYVGVEGDVEAVLAHLESADTWTAIDAIQNCNSLLPPVRNEQVRDVVKLIVFVLWLTTLRDFFNKCVENSSVFSAILTADGSASISSESDLIAGVRRFICQLWRRQLLGVVSLTGVYTVCTLLSQTNIDLTAEIFRRSVCASDRVSLQELIDSAVDRLPRQQLSRRQQQLTVISSHLVQRQQQRVLKEMIDQCESANERYLTLDAAHHWFWWHVCGVGWRTPAGRPLTSSGCCIDRQLSRDLLLEKIEQAQRAATCSPSVWDLLKDFEHLYNSVHQRLKWAAGANQQLSQLLEDHTLWASSVRQALSEALAVRDRICQVSSSLLLSEANRMSGTDSRSVSAETSYSASSDHDTHLKQLLEEVGGIMNCLDASRNSVVSEAEQALMELVSSDEECVDDDWLDTARNTVQDTLRSCSEEISRHQTTLSGQCRGSRDLTMQCCDLLSDQNRLVDGVRLLIKSVAKGCGGSLSADAVSCLSLFTIQSERFSHLLRSVVSGAASETALLETISLTDQLRETTETLYNSVFRLASELSVNSLTDVSLVQTTESSSEAVEHSDGGCNQYAVAVWRRVRQKLDGRDPDPTHVSTVSEQVQHTLQQAMTASRLARMYEGWTAWV